MISFAEAFVQVKFSSILVLPSAKTSTGSKVGHLLHEVYNCTDKGKQNEFIKEHKNADVHNRVCYELFAIFNKKISPKLFSHIFVINFRYFHKLERSSKIETRHEVLP